MRRLLRILLDAATVLSLVLCVATVAAWVRSYQASDAIRWSRANPLVFGFVTYLGGLFAAVVTPFKGSTLPPRGVRWDRRAPVSYAWVVGLPGTFFNRFGRALAYREVGGFAGRKLACPYWFILLLTAILPAARLVGRRRRARCLRIRSGLSTGPSGRSRLES